MNWPNDPLPRRFAVLEHIQSTGTHWDFLWEQPGEELLKTFQVPRGPWDWAASAPMRLQAIPDHRRIYLSYEGPISADRGHVRRVAEGRLTLEPRENAYRIAILDGMLQGDWEIYYRDDAWWLAPGATITH